MTDTDTTSTKYPPEATSGTAMVFAMAPPASEVTVDVGPEQLVPDVLKQIVKVVLAAYPAPVAAMDVPTAPAFGESTSVGGSELVTTAGMAGPPPAACVELTPVVRRRKIMPKEATEPLTKLRAPSNCTHSVPTPGDITFCFVKSPEVDHIRGS
jgi:hypothetical protein